MEEVGVWNWEGDKEKGWTVGKEGMVDIERTGRKSRSSTPGRPRRNTDINSIPLNQQRRNPPTSSNQSPNDPSVPFQGPRMTKKGNVAHHLIPVPD
jgi:hypothetical protein